MVAQEGIQVMLRWTSSSGMILEAWNLPKILFIPICCNSNATEIMAMVERDLAMGINGL